MSIHATIPSASLADADRLDVLKGVALQLAALAMNGLIAPEDLSDLGEVIARCRAVERECAPRRQPIGRAA